MGEDALFFWICILVWGLYTKPILFFEN